MSERSQQERQKHDANCELRGPGGAVDRRCSCGFRALRVEIATLRAECDAAQREVAALIEALDAEIAVLEQEARDRMGAEQDAERAGSTERANYSKGRRLATELCVSRLYRLKRVALQSTRPQERRYRRT